MMIIIIMLLYISTSIRALAITCVTTIMQSIIIIIGSVWC